MKTQFPTLELTPVSSSVAATWELQQVAYARSDMLQALWKLAGREDAAAADLINTLQQK